MTLAQTYRRLERLFVILMLLGILAMFQPWFRSIVELFAPLAPETNLGRTYRDDFAPIVFRYGFYTTFLSTIAFTVLAHYSVDDLRRAFEDKGVWLTLAKILQPVAMGFAVLFGLANAHTPAALLGVAGFICAIAVWHWRRWGFIGLALISIAQIVLLASGRAAAPITSAALLLSAIILVGGWPRRAHWT